MKTNEVNLGHAGPRIPGGGGRALAISRVLHPDRRKRLPEGTRPEMFAGVRFISLSECVHEVG